MVEKEEEYEEKRKLWDIKTMVEKEVVSILFGHTLPVFPDV